ncbi:hypothetical protein ABKN59_003303 [Abortiporus biennis]
MHLRAPLKTITPVSIGCLGVLASPKGIFSSVFGGEILQRLVGRIALEHNRNVLQGIPNVFAKVNLGQKGKRVQVSSFLVTFSLGGLPEPILDIGNYYHPRTTSPST